jgi:DNA-binding CsgD family transcriptional regulator
MSGESNRLSVVYSCDGETDDEKTWFLLLAFPHPESSDHIAVMHIDITILVSILSRYRKDVTADDVAGDLSAASASAGGLPLAGPAARDLLALIGEASEQRFPAHKQSQRSETKYPRHPPLSKRQMEVLALMAKGMTNAEIAHELSLSLNTVKVYVSGILARLGLQSRAQVLHWALTRRKDDADI